MAYDAAALRRASQRLNAQKKSRQDALERRRRELFARCPELGDIDRQLRGAMLDVVTSCLRAGSDPGPALAVIRDGNMDLQQRQAQLLRDLGYPPDALREVPVCKLCGDAGRPSGASAGTWTWRVRPSTPSPWIGTPPFPPPTGGSPPGRTWRVSGRCAGCTPCASAASR